MPENIRVKGVVGYSGALTKETFFDKKNSAPPLLLIHGTCDRVVPYGAGRVLQCPDNAPFRFDVFGSDALYPRAKAAGIPVVMHSVCGADHDAGSSNSNIATYNICRIKNWLARSVYNQPMPTYHDYREYLANTCGSYSCSSISCSDSSESFNRTSSTNNALPLRTVSEMWTVYPNPTTNDITLHSDEVIEQLYIINMLGRIEEVSLEPMSHTITVKNQARGVYTLRVKISGTWSVKNIVVY